MQILIGILIVFAPSILIFLGALIFSIARARHQTTERMTEFHRLLQKVS